MRMLSVSFRADVLTEGKCPSFSGCRIGIFCEGGCDRSCLGLGTLYRMFQTCGGRNRSAPSGRHSRLLHRPLSTNHHPAPLDSATCRKTGATRLAAVDHSHSAPEPRTPMLWVDI